MSLDTKYRPRTFSDVLGQEATIKILRRFVSSGRGRHQSYLFSGPWGSGKCVTGETLVPTDRGLRPIIDLMGEGKIAPTSIEVVQEGGRQATARYTYRGGLRSTLRVTTKMGYSIEGTPNHRIRVMHKEGTIGWCRLGDIQEGDFACLARHGSFGSGADLSGFVFSSHFPNAGCFLPASWEAPKTLSPEWGRLMGYLVGDGSCKSTHNIILSCADPEIKSDQLHLLQTLTGSGQETEDKRSTSGLSMLRSFRIRARAFLDFAGVHYVGAADKEVPWSILASPKAVVSDFLRGYFEADGHVAKSGVEVTTKSDLLAKQIQILLLLFGVVARRSIKRHRKDGTYYRLAINAPFWDTFAREIGFVSSRKRAAMSRLVSPTKGTNVREIVPHQTAWVRRFYTKLPKAFRTATLGRFFGCQYGLWQCTTTQVHKIARQYGEFDPDGHFRSLENSGYFFDPVTRVQTGQSEVFDLTVPDGEMFVANGFMNHNTTLGRILARALLCETPTPEGDPCDHCQSCRSVLDLGTSVDFTEVDAATNSGKADIQKITEEIQYDTFSGRRRLYLFDEAHQLSKDALDAMLKPLEENVPGSADKKLVCIFCTTEPEKMRATIFSRCAPAFIIQPVPPDSVAQRLAMICDQEGVPYERPMLVALAEMTECHIRDALKAIEGLSMLGGVMRENVISYMHLDLNSTYLEILESLGKDIGHAIQLTKQILLKASPATCYEKLAELSLLAYQMQIGGATPPAYLDSNRVSALGQQHGDSLIGFASRLSSRPARPTSAMLLCDLAVLHHGGAAGSQPVLVVSSARSTAIPTTVEFPPTTISPPTPGTQAPTLGKMPQSGEPTLRPGSFNTGETIPVRANGNGSSMRYGKDLTPEDFSKLLGQALKEELSRVGSARLTDMGSS